MQVPGVRAASLANAALGMGTPSMTPPPTPSPSAQELADYLVEAAKVLRDESLDGVAMPETAEILDHAATLLRRLSEIERERDDARGEVQRLEKLVYVPGVLKCAKCGCVLVTANLHVETGQFSANNDPQKCPNGCGPMWGRTEREAGNELYDRMDGLAERALKAESERDALREMLAQADAAASLNHVRGCLCGCCARHHDRLSQKGSAS